MVVAGSRKGGCCNYGGKERERRVSEKVLHIQTDNYLYKDTPGYSIFLLFEELLDYCTINDYI
jgi:hypothetical protein